MIFLSSVQCCLSGWTFWCVWNDASKIHWCCHDWTGGNFNLFIVNFYFCLLCHGDWCCLIYGMSQIFFVFVLCFNTLLIEPKCITMISTINLFFTQGVGGTFAALASILSLLGKLTYGIKHIPCTCIILSFCHRVNKVLKRPLIKRILLKYPWFRIFSWKVLEFLQEPMQLNVPKMCMWQKICQAQIWV